MGAFCGLQDQPLACQILVLVVFPQSSDDLVGDFFKVGQGKGQDGRAGTGEADSEEARLGLGRHGLDNLAQARDKGLAVGLVDFVLHSQVNEFWVGWRLAQSNGKQGYPLQIEYLNNPELDIIQE